MRTLLIRILRLATTQQIRLFLPNILGFHQKYIFTSNWEEKNKVRYHDYIQISTGYYRFSQLLSLTTSPVNYLISHLPLVRFPPLNIIQFLNNRSKFIRISDYVAVKSEVGRHCKRKTNVQLPRQRVCGIENVSLRRNISTVRADKKNTV